MAASNTRRLLALLAGAAGVAALLTAQAPVSSAASSSTLFAITRTQQQLVRIDPSSGSLAPITSLFPNCSGNCPLDSQSSELASDPTTHRLFAIRTNSFSFNFPPVFTQELLTIDSQSGAILSNPLINANAPQALVFDTSNNTLFGFTGSAIVTVDPATASIVPFAQVGGNGGSVNQMALSPSTNTIYVSEESLFLPPPPLPTQLFAVDTTTGAVAAPVTVDTPVRYITTDGGALFGLTDNFAATLVRIDPATGATTPVASAPFLGSSFIPTGPVTDPTTHTVFIDVSVWNGFQFTDDLVAINDQSGSSSITPLLSIDNLTTLVIEAPPPVTPESIKADVRAALASGGIDNAGIAAGLLAKLDAAARVRAGATASPARTNACATSADIYGAFINDVVALSGGAASGARGGSASGARGHISAATASQLISEAQFLIANCP